MTSPVEPPAPGREYPVFIKAGDARPEVDEVVRSLALEAQAAGLHRIIYAERAHQTVVLVTQRSSPLAAELRTHGWEEPRDLPHPSGS